MCEPGGAPGEAQASMPRPAPGAAVDPIALEPVDEVEIVTLVDNVYDGLLTSDERTRRAGFGAGTVAAPQFDGGRTDVGMIAEHGFAALVAGQGGRNSTSTVTKMRSSGTGAPSA